MHNFFRLPRKRFNGVDWTVLLGFSTIAGPFRFGNDADYAIARLGGSGAATPARSDR